jgi:hypothetical protein
MKTFRERCSPIHHLFDYYNLQVAEFASLPRIEFEKKKKKKVAELAFG